MQIARAGRSQVGNRSPALIRSRAGRAPGPSWVSRAVRVGDRDRIVRTGEPLLPTLHAPTTPAGEEAGSGRRGRALSLQPRVGAPPPHCRSWRVKMRALIVTKRRRPPASPLPGAVRAALAAARPLCWPHLQPGHWWRGEGAERLGPPPPAPPPKPGRSCPRLCAPFVPRRDRCATLIRRVTDGGGDRRFHLLTSNVGAGEGEPGARPWPARWLK